MRYLMAQQTIVDGRTVPLLHGVFAIFGHGNVAGLGEALAQVRDACRPCARTTSRRWRTPRSPTRRRIVGGA